MKMKTIARTRFSMKEDEFLLFSPLEYQVIIAVDNEQQQLKMYDYMDALRWHSSVSVIALGGKRSNLKLQKHMKFPWDRLRLQQSVHSKKIKHDTLIELDDWKDKYIPTPEIINKNKKRGKITNS